MRLSRIDTIVLLLGVLVAILLHIVRQRRGIASASAQGLNDMLGFWTTFELVYISVSCLQDGLLARFGIIIPDPAEIIKSNGPLVPFALASLVVGKSTIGTSVFAIRDDKPKESR